MQHAIDYSDMVHPRAGMRDPSEAEINKVADSIEAYLKLDEANWQRFAKDHLDFNVDEAFAIAMQKGEWAEAGLQLHAKAKEQMRERAVELAESWLWDELLPKERLELIGWRPVKYAALGRRYHLAELLG